MTRVSVLGLLGALAVPCSCGSLDPSTAPGLAHPAGESLDPPTELDPPDPPTELDPPDPPTEADIVRAGGFFNQGLDHFHQRRWNKAIAKWREALRHDPKGQFDARSMIGDALSRQGRVDEAISEYRAASQIKPWNIAHHREIVLALSTHGRFDEAASELLGALRTLPSAWPNPDVPSAMIYTDLGDVYSEAGRGDEAISAYRSAVRLLPRDDEAYSGIGRVFYRNGELDEALSAFRMLMNIETRGIPNIRPAIRSRHTHIWFPHGNSHWIWFLQAVA